MVSITNLAKEQSDLSATCSHVANPASGFDWLFECAPLFHIDGNNARGK
jgi:hypothetical protein